MGVVRRDSEDVRVRKEKLKRNEALKMMAGIQMGMVQAIVGGASAYEEAEAYHPHMVLNEFEARVLERALEEEPDTDRIDATIMRIKMLSADKKMLSFLYLCKTMLKKYAHRRDPNISLRISNTAHDMCLAMSHCIDSNGQNLKQNKALALAFKELRRSDEIMRMIASSTDIIHRTKLLGFNLFFCTKNEEAMDMLKKAILVRMGGDMNLVDFSEISDETRDALFKEAQNQFFEKHLLGTEFE